MLITKHKVCYLLDTISNPNAGTESQFIKLFLGLKLRGEDVHLAVLRDSDYLQKQQGIAYSSLNISRLFAISSLIKMLRFAWQLKKQKVELVHIFFNDASIIAPIILKLLGIKVIISRRDMGFWYSSLNRPILKLNSLFVDCAVVNSRAVKQITHQVEALPQSKIEVIYNGYNLDNQADATTDMPSGTILGIVANIRPIKRMQDAVAALAKLLPQFPDLQLVIVGAGQAKTLQKQAEQLGAAEHLHCIGPKPVPLNYIEQFDIGLLCSESEGFSNAIIEYLHAGKPVVCSQVGGNPEIIEHGQNGYLYPAGDVEQLSEHIKLLLTEKNDYRRMCENAVKSVKTRFDEPIMLDNYQSLYSAILGCEGQR